MLSALLVIKPINPWNTSPMGRGMIGMKGRWFIKGPFRAQYAHDYANEEESQ